MSSYTNFALGSPFLLLVLGCIGIAVFFALLILLLSRGLLLTLFVREEEPVSFSEKFALFWKVSPLSANGIALVRLYGAIIIMPFAYEYFKHPNMWIIIVIIVSLYFTDWLDGFLARVLGNITLFGKWLDPFADKVLVYSNLFIVCLKGEVTTIFIALSLSMLCFDFLGQIARNGASDPAANSIGKTKMVLQVIIIILACLKSCYAIPIGNDILIIYMMVCNILAYLSYASKLKIN